MPWADDGRAGTVALLAVAAALLYAASRAAAAALAGPGHDLPGWRAVIFELATLLPAKSGRVA